MPLKIFVKSANRAGVSLGSGIVWDALRGWPATFGERSVRGGARQAAWVTSECAAPPTCHPERSPASSLFRPFFGRRGTQFKGSALGLLRAHNQNSESRRR